QHHGPRSHVTTQHRRIDRGFFARGSGCPPGDTAEHPHCCTRRAETISYQIPSFTLNGALVYFAAFRKHIGFYPHVTGDAGLEKAISPRVEARELPPRWAHDRGVLVASRSCGVARASA